MMNGTKVQLGGDYEEEEDDYDYDDEEEDDEEDEEEGDDDQGSVNLVQNYKISKNQNWSPVFLCKIEF